MRIQLITKSDSLQTGMSRYTQNLYGGLLEMKVDARLVSPLPFGGPALLDRTLEKLGLDLGAFFASYPLRVRLEACDLYHLTGQTLATLLLFRRMPGPVVVTVHDLIPYLVRHDPRLNPFRHVFDLFFYRLSMLALRRADAIVAVSDYTRRTVIDTLGVPGHRVHTVYETVDYQRFCPLEVPDAFKARYGLVEGERYMLYVGSEDPRKNLEGLIEALPHVKRQVAGTKLLKVGAPHFEKEHQRLRARIAELQLDKDVLFVGQVSEGELPFFYNVADLLVMPSLFEGFGLPVLEAMACARPVVISDRGSLPEVGGHAAVIVDPTATEDLAEQIVRILADPDHARSLGQAAYERAMNFSPTVQSQAMVALYRGLLSGKSLVPDQVPERGESDE